MAGIIISIDTTGLEPKMAEAFEELEAELQGQFNAALESFGKVVNLAYADVGFSAPLTSGAAWAVGPGSFRYVNYAILGDLMIVNFAVKASTVTGTPTALIITGIRGFRAVIPENDTKIQCPIGIETNTSTAELGICSVQNNPSPTGSGPAANPGESVIFKIEQADGGTFPNTGGTSVYGTVIFPCVRV